MRRQKQNPRYSLRAFARDLKISPSRLTEVFAKKNGLSSVSAKKISEILNHNKEEQEWFFASVESQHARSKTQRTLATESLRKLQTIQKKSVLADEFKLIADWYHLSILELLNVKNAKPTIQWISEQLGITETEASSGLERLLRLGWVQLVGEKWTCRKEYRSMTAPIAFKTMQRYQKQLIAKAEKAIAQQKPSERALQSLVLALPKKNYGKAVAELESFCHEFNQKYNSKKELGDHVYALTLQFFRISKGLTEGTTP